MDMKKDIRLKHYNLNLVDFKKIIFFNLINKVPLPYCMYYI